MLDTVGIGPFLGLEVTFHCDEGALGQDVKGLGLLVLAPCLDVHEG